LKKKDQLQFSVNGGFFICLGTFSSSGMGSVKVFAIFFFIPLENNRKLSKKILQNLKGLTARGRGLSWPDPMIKPGTTAISFVIGINSTMAFRFAYSQKPGFIEGVAVPDTLHYRDRQGFGWVDNFSKCPDLVFLGFRFSGRLEHTLSGLLLPLLGATAVLKIGFSWWWIVRFLKVPVRRRGAWVGAATLHNALMRQKELKMENGELKTLQTCTVLQVIAPLLFYKMALCKCSFGWFFAAEFLTSARETALLFFFFTDSFYFN